MEPSRCRSLLSPLLGQSTRCQPPPARAKLVSKSFLHYRALSALSKKLSWRDWVSYLAACWKQAYRLPTHLIHCHVRLLHITTRVSTRFYALAFWRAILLPRALHAFRISDG